MAEWALGRRTRRGPVGAFAAAGLPFGRAAGWFFFAVVAAATAYYTAVIGWVLYYAVAELLAPVVKIRAAAVLPPDTGFDGVSFALQLACTAAVILSCAFVLLRGLRAGIERASAVILPLLLVITIVLLVRALTLPGAMAGVRWYILELRWSDIDARVAMAALGHAIFSLSLGGTFMVVYGSYLSRGEGLLGSAVWTTLGDTLSGLLAGLAIIPAVFAFGLEPTSGPGLVFSTLPQVFAAMPAGWLFGFLFFVGLLCAGYLSDIGAFEVLVAGLTDNTKLSRRAAVWLVAALVLVLSMPPTINNAIFIPWDLTFGSGMQTLGALLAVVDPRLVPRPQHRPRRALQRRHPLRPGLALLLDPFRRPRRHPRRRHLVAPHQRPRRRHRGVIGAATADAKSLDAVGRQCDPVPSRTESLIARLRAWAFRLAA